MKCRWCGKEFEAKRRDAKYCSDECRHEANLARYKEYRLKHRENRSTYNRQWYRKKKEAEQEETRLAMQSQKENQFWQAFLKSLERADRLSIRRLMYYESHGIS